MTKIGHGQNCMRAPRARAARGRRTGLRGGPRGTVVQNLRAEFEQNIETLLSRVSKISTRGRQDFAAKYRKPSSKFRLGLLTTPEVRCTNQICTQMALRKKICHVQHDLRSFDSKIVSVDHRATFFLPKMFAGNVALNCMILFPSSHC